MVLEGRSREDRARDRLEGRDPVRAHADRPPRLLAPADSLGAALSRPSGQPGRESRARPRLAHRDAGRRALPRGVLRAVPRRRPLHAPARARLGVARDRAPPDRDLVHPAAARRRPALPLLPARSSPRRSGASISGATTSSSRSSHAVAKGVRVPAGRAARLLLLHADALRLGPLRRLLRRAARAASPGSSCRRWRRPSGAGTGAPPRACTTSWRSRASSPTGSGAATGARPT